MPAAQRAIAVVDPVSTGANVALEAHLRGFAVIAVWTAELPPAFRSHVPTHVREKLSFHAEVEECEDDIVETTKRVRSAAGGLELIACFCGCESGVKVTDSLSSALGVRSNGTELSNARRNKKEQQDAVARSGMRAVREACGTTWAEVSAFVDSEPMPVIVKPAESAGSDGVKLCRTAAEAQEHFHKLLGEQRKFGAQGAPILVQEFLVGKEYVIDQVSRDGVHKTCMVWLYDKRPLNGAPFVYFNMLPVSDKAVIDVLVPYARGVLDALGIRHGPSHGEVMLTKTGPCLVEMNCRTHGGDGAWVPLARALTGGYSQVDATILAYDKSPAAFGKLPSLPPLPFKACGQEVLLVSTDAGKVVAAPGLEAICKLRSFISLECGIHVGSHVERTVDVFTQVGSAILCHKDRAVLDRDVQAIRQMEAEGRIFVLEHHTTVLSPLPSMVRQRSRSGSAGELRRQFDALSGARLARSRNSSAVKTQDQLERSVAEALLESPDAADGGARANGWPPQDGGSAQHPSALSDSGRGALMLALGFALGLSVGLARGGTR